MRNIRLALAGVMLLAALAIPPPSRALAAARVTLPDLRILVPTGLISVGLDPSSGDRELRFTHITADTGAGPFEIDPTYNPITGTSTFVQAIYNSPSPGVWRRDHTVPVVAVGVWEPPSDYQFPLTKFTLNTVNPDGSPGALVATSPKRDYCITGDYRLAGIPNTPDQTFIPQDDCGDPTKPLGWSVGWGDEYDQTDAGQPIDLTGVPDGTYILHAIVDPRRVLTQSNTGNDVTDTKIRLSGDNVIVLSQTHPGGTAQPAPVPLRLTVRSVRWHRGVLSLVVSGVPKRGRLSVKLEFPHGRARVVIANTGRVRLRTPKPQVVVIRLLEEGRQVGHAIAVRLDSRLALRITNPVSGETLSGTVPIVAAASGGARLSSVQFAVDGKQIGRVVTGPPYVLHWNTKRATRGRHTITALATDVRGKTGSARVRVDVQNPAPPMTCFVLQAHVNAHGRGSATTPALHSAMSGETLLALVSADGPPGAHEQAATVSGAGLRWRLVKRANASSGDSEIWTATASRILKHAQITSQLARRSFDESVTVVALEGARGVGAASAASGSTGAAHVNLTTRGATSLVFAVGNDWDRAVRRGLPVGWVRLDQWLDTGTGDTFWSQYTNQPVSHAGSTVAVRDLAPATDQWNLAAVELPGDGS